MTARIPTPATNLMSSYLAQVQVVARTMSGVTTLEALERAEAAIDRMPSKAELRMALRSVKAVCRENARMAPRSDDLAIPAMPAGVVV